MKYKIKRIVNNKTHEEIIKDDMNPEIRFAEVIEANSKVKGQVELFLLEQVYDKKYKVRKNRIMVNS